MNSELSDLGISAFAAWIPRFKVDLEEWCQWTGNNWNKVRHVTGDSFRLPGPHENVYTMAANAVVRLIRNNQLDPREIGFLGLGTESSIDNAAGAVIVRGMVDMALQRFGLPLLPRQLEVPEFKHACLGGIYALKSALRYVALDGWPRKAIVVSADIAEYERGSSGEQTQGAGAIAMLVEKAPRILTVDLSHAGSASAWRSNDFRKPMVRHHCQQYCTHGGHHHDYPVFNGRYSTWAYLDEVAHAAEAMVSRMNISLYDYCHQTSCLCFHRPYHQMPLKALSFLYVRALMQSADAREELIQLCAEAELSPESLADEKNLPERLASADFIDGEPTPFPLTTRLADRLRARPDFQAWLANKMGPGTQLMRQIGNLYSASLPAVLAATLEEAYVQNYEFAGDQLAAFGYGSGDAAEALTLRLCPRWREGCAQTGLRAALDNAITLNRREYEELHDTGMAQSIRYEPSQEFVISHVGYHYGYEYQDLGVEYYDWRQ